MDEAYADIVSWLRGLTELGCTFMPLNPGARQPKKSWDNYEHLTGQTGLSSALEWLKHGVPFGILPQPPLWILDADSQDEVKLAENLLLDARIVPLPVRTPHHGMHFYFLLPDGFQIERLKNHLCHPIDDDGIERKVDWKFGPRTMVVAPGTVRDGKLYEPLCGWRTPPKVDPSMFLTGGEFWHITHPFLVDDRPEMDRICRAKTYLARRAPISISGKRGKLTLAGVCSHLVAYLGIHPKQAFRLLTSEPHSWNSRCIDKVSKQPYPWSTSELINACNAASGSVPAAGVLAFKRMKEEMELKSKLSDCVSFLRESLTMKEEVRVPVAIVLQLFQAAGLPDLTNVSLGDELVAQGVRRIPATRRRIMCIPCLDILALQNRFKEKSGFPHQSPSTSIAADQEHRTLGSLRGVESQMPRPSPLDQKGHPNSSGRMTNVHGQAVFLAEYKEHEQGKDSNYVHFSAIVTALGQRTLGSLRRGVENQLSSLGEAYQWAEPLQLNPKGSAQSSSGMANGPSCPARVSEHEPEQTIGKVASHQNLSAESESHDKKPDEPPANKGSRPITAVATQSASPNAMTVEKSPVVVPDFEKACKDLPHDIAEVFEFWNSIVEYVNQDAPDELHRWKDISQKEYSKLTPLTRECLQDEEWLPTLRRCLIDIVNHPSCFPLYFGNQPPRPPYIKPFILYFRYLVSDDRSGINRVMGELRRSLDRPQTQRMIAAIDYRDSLAVQEQDRLSPPTEPPFEQAGDPVEDAPKG